MSLLFISQGMAVVHNLIVGPVNNVRNDKRTTPFHKPHSTEFFGLYPCGWGDSGDHRFYNNIILAPCKLSVLDNSALPCFSAGNVFTKGTQPSKFDTSALVATNFDVGIKLEQKSDGWYLTLAEDPTWRQEVKRQLVTTELLGKAKVPECAYENANGSPLRIDTDYFGLKRNKKNPFPGPIETFAGHGQGQGIKVWNYQPMASVTSNDNGHSQPPKDDSRRP